MSVKSILLIDDDEVTNYINKKVVSVAYPQAEIVVALNGQDALKVIDNRSQTDKPPFDVVLIDISMPYMDGWEFTENLSQEKYAEYHRKKICMLTSSVFDDDMQRALSYPIIKGFFSKPLDSLKVKDIIGQ